MKTELREVFVQAQELHGEERERFLQSACGQDTILHRQVLELLLKSEKADAFFGEGTQLISPSDVTIEVAQEKAGDRIGNYVLRQRIGEGGCGVVYVAEQMEPVRRRVALKVIRLGMDTRQVVARFEAERQALAMMDHPNIAKVLDAGTTNTGRPYFIMELVRGIKITDYCDQNNLSTTDRLHLFVLVCHAIQHAHQKGIIHRDIKPSNILVTLHDGVPVPKVIDFGIAKATEGRLTDATVFTQLNQFIGTPAYMSPEQAEMSGLDIDTRSDIYSLGVLLYELLTGRTPFDARELMAQGIDAMRKTIRETDPIRPSTKLATLEGGELTTTARRRSVESAKLAKLLRGDLDWIAMKCLEKDRTRRYETANGLASDINRHLGDEPVVARPPSKWYVLQKRVRRHKVGFAATAAVALVLMVGIIASTLQAVRATRAERKVAAERDAKEQARQEAESVASFLTRLLQSPDPSRDGRDIKVAELLEQAKEWLVTKLEDQPARRAKLQDTLAQTYFALGLFREAMALQETVLEYHRTASGSEHPDTLRAMGNLAAYYTTAGRRNEALKLEEEVLRLFRNVLGPEHRDTLTGMQNLAASYLNAGEWDKAIKLQEEALTLCRKVLGQEDPVTLVVMHGLAESDYKVGRYNEALALQEEVLTLSSKVLGPEHPSTLAARLGQARYYQALGRWEEALKLLEEGLELRRKVLGPEHRDTLSTMQDLADSYESAGQDNKAMELREEGLKLCRSVLGPEHPETITAMGNLAMSYRIAGRGQEALELRKKELAFQRRILGPEHPDTVNTMYNLANCYQATGQPDAALKLREEVLALRRKAIGPEHPRTLNAMCSLAVSYHEAGQLDEAMTLQEEALALRHKVLGPSHPDTLRAMFNLGIYYGAAGRSEKAVELHEEALSLYGKVLGLEHPSTLSAMGALANSYQAVRRQDEALKLREKLLGLHRKVQGQEHPDTLQVMHDLASSYHDNGRREEALKLREEMLALDRKALGREHPSTLHAMQDLATSYSAADRQEEALKLREDGLALYRAVLGPEHPDTLGAMNNLALSYNAGDRLEEALLLQEEVLALDRTVLGLEHSDTLMHIRNLLQSYDTAGRGEDALKLRAELSTLEPEDTELAMRVAAQQAWLGQEAEYLATCRRMLQWSASSQKPGDAERVAKLASLHPTSDPQIASAALKLARRAVALGQTDTNLMPWYQLALGMAEYRNGHHSQADEAFGSAAEKAGATSDKNMRYKIGCIAGFYRAMARFHQGKDTEARALFSSTETIMKPLPADTQSPLPENTNHDDLIVWLACMETKALLNIGASAEP